MSKQKKIIFIFTAHRRKTEATQANELMWKILYEFNFSLQNFWLAKILLSFYATLFNMLPFLLSLCLFLSLSFGTMEKYICADKPSFRRWKCILIQSGQWAFVLHQVQNIKINKCLCAKLKINIPKSVRNNQPEKIVTGKRNGVWRH